MQPVDNLLVRDVQDVKIRFEGRHHADGLWLHADAFIARHGQGEQFRRGVSGNADFELPSRFCAVVNRRISCGNNLAGPRFQIVGNACLPIPD